MYQVRNALAPDYIGELFNFANKGYSLRNADFDILRYSTARYQNTLLGTWAHTFGPDYPQEIDSDSHWTILHGTSERKTWLLLLRARAPIVTYVSLNHVCNGILSLFN